MTYQGRFENGVVVFDDPISLDDGTLVRVEPVSDPSDAPRRGSPHAIRRCTARWEGEPAELDELLSEVQRSRDVDLTPVDDS